MVRESAPGQARLGSGAVEKPAREQIAQDARFAYGWFDSLAYWAVTVTTNTVEAGLPVVGVPVTKTR